jgi:nicotinate phosphoribosyltransferase
MMQVAFHKFPAVNVKYEFVNRLGDVKLGFLKQDLETRLDFLCETSMRKDELEFLRRIRFLSSDFIDYLEDFKLKRRYVKIENIDGDLKITIEGPWLQTILFEVPILAMISELYNKSKTVVVDKWMSSARYKLDEKMDFYRNLETPFYFTDFGTRRRHSLAWQTYMVQKLQSEFPNTFMGSSNLLICKGLGLRPIGTMAHEYIQVGQGLENVQLKNSQKFMLEKWIEEYRGDLGYALTDTIGIDAFLNDFDLYLAKLYDGCRHDSGDPIIWGHKVIEKYKQLGIDPKTKMLIFSDGLNFERAAEINKIFSDKVKTSFGIGTNLSNDGNIKSLSIVIKLVEVNGNPVAKISDEPGKVICKDPQFLEYLKKVYNVEA